MKHYGDSVLRSAYLLVRDQHLAEDISQETFLVAHQKRDQLRDPARTGPWLLQITVNLCRQRMRRAAWRRVWLRERIDEQIPDTTAQPEMATTRIVLAEAIGRLPYKYREAIVLFYYQTLSITEMSVSLQEPEGTVKSKLSRARAMLKDQLMREGWME